MLSHSLFTSIKILPITVLMQCLGVETLRGMRNEYFSSLYQEAEAFAKQKGIPATPILANSVVLPKRVQTLSSLTFCCA